MSGQETVPCNNAVQTTLNIVGIQLQGLKQMVYTTIQYYQFIVARLHICSTLLQCKIKTKS